MHSEYFLANGKNCSANRFSKQALIWTSDSKDCYKVPFQILKEKYIYIYIDPKLLTCVGHTHVSITVKVILYYGHVLYLIVCVTGEVWGSEYNTTPQRLDRVGETTLSPIVFCDRICTSGIEVIRKLRGRRKKKSHILLNFRNTLKEREKLSSNAPTSSKRTSLPEKVCLLR